MPLLDYLRTSSGGKAYALFDRIRDQEVKIPRLVDGKKTLNEVLIGTEVKGFEGGS
jgi:hypothetical protein